METLSKVQSEEKVIVTETGERMTEAEYNRRVERGKELDMRIREELPKLQKLVNERVNLFRYPSPYKGLLSKLNFYVEADIPQLLMEEELF